MMPHSATIVRLTFAILLGLPAGGSSGSLWDKPPEQWNQADAYRILRDSPWSPAQVKLEVNSTQRHTDKQTGLVTDSPVNPADTPLVPGVELSREKSLPKVSVLWWSSKTVRLAQQRLRQLSVSSGAYAGPLSVEDLPDFVLAIEGNEPLRIFQDAREDLHDTVFLELPEGITLDLSNVTFIGETKDEEARVEFHFPRQVAGGPALDPDAERVIFHCKATAKTPRLGHQDALSIRVEFHPRAMRARGKPDF